MTSPDFLENNPFTVRSPKQKTYNKLDAGATWSNRPRRNPSTAEERIFEQYKMERRIIQSFEAMVVAKKIGRTDQRRAWEREWLKKQDPTSPVMLAKRIRNVISNRLRKKIKRGLSFTGVKVDTRRIILHIQSQFKRGMNWDNWGKLWHLDHIVPLSKFDLTKPDEVARANHWSNLRPDLIFNNLSRGAKGGGQVHLLFD